MGEHFPDAEVDALNETLADAERAMADRFRIEVQVPLGGGALMFGRTHGGWGITVVPLNGQSSPLRQASLALRIQAAFCLRDLWTVAETATRKRASGVAEATRVAAETVRAWNGAKEPRE